MAKVIANRSEPEYPDSKGKQEDSFPTWLAVFMCVGFLIIVLIALFYKK